MSIDYTLKAPGVYFEEFASAGPIAGAGTSTVAFIGAVTGAGTEVGAAVTNWSDFTARFGGFTTAKPLAYAVRGFFQNGGSLAYIVPTAGAAGLPAALDALTRIPEVNIVCYPGLVDATAQGLILAHCEQMRNRFAVLDGAEDETPTKADGALMSQRGDLESAGGFGALYWPWFTVDDPIGTGTGPHVVSVPPSGHVAGIMARSDAAVGVHKAPANEVVRGVIDLGHTLNDAEQGQLNKANINAIRRFPGRPPLLWGARTLTTDTAWQYVNVRRLVAWIEDSLGSGLRWAVFQPNNTGLWKTLERSVSDFLNRVWQSGALFGTTAGQAFYVRIDEELNPPSVRDLGQVVIEIGVAPVRPAEFVVVRLGLWDGGTAVDEG